MGMSDRIKNHYRNRVLRQGNGFAERGQFARKRSEKYKTLETSVTESRETNEDLNTVDKVERIEVFIHRDTENENGGVDDLYHGDKYIRDPEFDSNQAPFIFNGRILEKGQHYIRAEFERYRRNSQGAGRG